MENKTDISGPERAALTKNGKTFSWIWLAVLVIAGAYVRFFDLNDPPLDFHPTRRLHSLIIARGVYYHDAPGITEDQRQTAMRQAQAEGRVEPPILEWIVAQTYRVTGGESTVVARIYSILFWVVGGVLLFFFSRKYWSDLGSLVSVGFYLILPYGVYASRAFQPDPLMSMMCILSWFLFARWIEKPGWSGAILPGIVGGITLFIKTTAVFYLGGVFLGILIATRQYRILAKRQTWIMLLLFALPTAIYTAAVWLDPAAGGGVTSLRFFPSYWTKIEWYLTWFNLLDRNIGMLWIVLSFIGGLTLTSRVLKGIYWGGLFGYVVMGFVLPHHISTHDYYILPLIPLLGLGLGGLAEVIKSGLPATSRLAKWAIAAVLVVLVLGNVYQARTTLKRTDYRQEPAFWQNIAQQLAPYGPAVGLTQDYGLRLTYWGGISTTNWFTADEIRLRQTSGQEINLEALFAEKTENAGAFLVTMADEFERQPGLKQILDDRYPQVSTQPGVLLYDLRSGEQN